MTFLVEEARVKACPEEKIDRYMLRPLRLGSVMAAGLENIFLNIPNHQALDTRVGEKNSSYLISFKKSQAKN